MKRVILDTNMMHDYFVNQARALKRKEDALLPKKYSFMLAEKERGEMQ
ncbi:MAG: hypothetical protein HY514_02145 [Candidatus Aenigmarchaeota archaeon]|nr:hypothetical protein [Candidatus Aenigmarchaeota archaeon]